MITPLMPTYKRLNLAFERGEGAWLYTHDGRRFLDFGAGIATSSLGHNHPHLVAAIRAQAGRLIHVSNVYRIPEAERLAERLVAATFADSVFFCNSGAEANEAMVKMIRRTMAETGQSHRYRIICFEGAFHGRTLAALAATGNPKYLQGYAPDMPGFDHVPFNDLEAVRHAIGPETAGIIVEPIQGEGGIRPARFEFLQGLRTLADEFGLVLGIDEIQTGMGRTGRFLAHEWAGITPDVVTLAKGIAGGVPMGAVLAREWVARHLTPGSHGSTFGGNPLAVAAAHAVLDVILAPGFLKSVEDRGFRLREGLVAIVDSHPTVFEEVRGLGLMLGLKCVIPQDEVQQALIDEGLLVINAGDNVVRLTPPLIISEAEIDQALAMISRAADRLAARAGERAS